MSNLQLQFVCTVHNMRFGYDRPQRPKVEPAWLRCPQCDYETKAEMTLQINTLTEHRDLLLQTIDLKKLYQPMKESEA